MVAALLAPIWASAVTQKEMEQARTIAAKAYLRYANDGSGYLDELNPVTMDELEAKLKAKEKENIKAFKEIPVPADYKEWDKDKLVEYWGVTAFQSSNLLEKGRGGRLRAKPQIAKMSVTEPQISAPAAQNNQAPTAENSTPTTPAPAPEATPPTQAEPEPAQAAAPTESENPAQELENIQNQETEILADEENFENDAQNLEKASDDSWVYIMVLCILVAVVIALVVYAANVMKKSNKKGAYGAEGANDPQMAEKLEHFESSLTEKNGEVLMLTKKLESANRQNAELKAKVEALTAELASLRNEAGSKPTYESQVEPAERPKHTLRSIFLGRANAKGIFVRADRTLNMGNSIFVLETSDGYSGTFRVADSPAAWSLALSNPREYLETACTGYDLDNTSNASQIATETSGTAVFEGGCWRVIRKARIRYES